MNKMLNNFIMVVAFIALLWILLVASVVTVKFIFKLAIFAVLVYFLVRLVIRCNGRK